MKTARWAIATIGMVVLAGISFCFVGDYPARADDCEQTTTEAETKDGIILDTRWSGTCTLDQWQPISRNETLTIAPGSRILFAHGGGLRVEGALRARGTVDAPIVFDRTESNVDSYQVELADGSVTTLRNARILRGGLMYGAIRIIEHNPWPFIATAYADVFRSGAITVQSGARLDAEAVDFRDNVIALSADREAQVKVWRSSFVGNTHRAFLGEWLVRVADLRYNWWGRAEGPRTVCNMNCDLGTIHEEGDVEGPDDVGDQARSADFLDPVIVLPGILGSWRWTDRSEAELDPIFHIYDNLVESLELNGYVKGQTLFALPYEWRRSNVVSAQDLAAKIQSVKDATHWPRVDVVAHSMGGLVARQYIEGGDYGDDIDQLITLGTPETGSPKAYLIWEAGEFTRSPSDILIQKALSLESDENGYSNLFEYIRKGPIPSVQELLPTTDYLVDVGGEMRKYPDRYPRNTFLESLNQPGKTERLKQVELDAIVASQQSDTTVERIRVGKPSVSTMGNALALWEYGKPDNYDSFLGDRGTTLGKGDGTVPLASAMGIPTDQVIQIDAEHSELPSAAKGDVVRFLLNKTPVSKPVWNPENQSLLAFFVHSPVDLSVTAPDGTTIGRDFAHGRDYASPSGAYYTGSDTQTEFITIRNPQAGAYSIHTQGTGTGNFRVETVAIQRQSDGSATESTADFRGATTPGADQSSTVTLAGDMTLAPQTDVADTPPEVSPGTDAGHVEPADIVATVAVPAAVTVDVNVPSPVAAPVDLEGDIKSSSRHDRKQEEVATPPMRKAAVNLATADLALGAVTEDNLDSVVADGAESVRAADAPARQMPLDTSSPWFWLVIVAIVVATPFGLLRLVRSKLG